MKTYAPKGLTGADLRALLADLHATPAQVAKFLRVTERSVWRWLSDESAPYAVLAALWHETPQGRYATALDVGNELSIVRGLAAAHGAQAERESARLARLLQISDTGAANDPLKDHQTRANCITVPTGRPAAQYKPAAAPAAVWPLAVTVAVAPVSLKTMLQVRKQPPKFCCPVTVATAPTIGPLSTSQ